MPSGSPKTVFAAMVALVAWIGAANGASIRVSGPAEIVPGTSYAVYVEAENTGLAGMPTDGIGWEFESPQYLSFDYFGAPSSGDFFSRDDGTPISMFGELFGNPVTPGALSARLVADYGAGPVDRSWSSNLVRLGEYHFRIDSNPPAPLPLSDGFVLTGIIAIDPDLNEQAFTNLTPTFDFDIRLSRADSDRDTKVNQADMNVFEACATGPNVPYDLNNLPSGCTCGTVNANGQDYLTADFDNDGDVDEDDFGQMQRCYAGDTIADPNCGNALLGFAKAAVKVQSVRLPNAGPQFTGPSPLIQMALIRNSPVHPSTKP